jgi:NAD(P)-dependent dehydrogenase (short-subunit alcohol dehydrogenase family)
MSWHPDDISDLTGTRALVTGTTSGLGYQTALELHRHGAVVVLAARNTDRAEQVADELAGLTGRDRPDVLELDLADLASVRSAAARAVASYDGLDLLVNNAGVMAAPERRTADGFELQVGTNHLGHFALTGLLLPLLTRSAAPRVVTVTSVMHRLARRVGLGDLRGAGRYGKWDAYSKSKLANLLFTQELDRRARAAGLPLLSTGAHPGYAATHLQTSGARLGTVRADTKALAVITKVVAQPASSGAWPSLYAATAPGLPGGAFVGSAFVGWGAPRLERPSRAARDAEAGRRLWEWSASATGVDYP